MSRENSKLTSRCSYFTYLIFILIYTGHPYKGIIKQQKVKLKGSNGQDPRLHRAEEGSNGP